ncbi:MAG: hypothetical protein HYV26_11505 [Candidatus Hydrogenedentes bacterium]|nr:hypothetical protein [Candidatus Hydrogenedentota bacterium]
MFGEGSLTFQEFVMQEPLPITTVQQAVFRFLKGRDDVVMFGAHAVNAYVSEARMSQDVDIMAVNAKEIAEALRSFLAAEFHIAVRVRRVKEGIGYRIYQLRKPENRHLADIRNVERLPQSKLVDGVQVLTPELTIAGKVNASWQRRNHPKSDTDRRDIRYMLLAFPEWRKHPEKITVLLLAAGAAEGAIQLWNELAAGPLDAHDEGF